MPFTPAAHAGTLHHYAPRLVAFEHGAPTATNFVLFFGGLGDALLTVRYPAVLAARLPAAWSVVDVQLSSSHIGWTTSSLQRDAQQAGLAVAYFRALAAQRSPTAPAAKIVLLGHSTGAQITTTYLIGAWKDPPTPRALPDNRPPVDALVLQAGISDREGASAALPADELAASLALAKEWVAAGRGGDVLPRTSATGLFVAVPSAERWVSLVDGEGDDDLFSADVGEAREQRVWGADGLAGRGVRVLVLLGAEDEHMHPAVDRGALVRRWGDAVRRGGGVWDEGSGVVPGATHNLNTAGEGAVADLCGRIAALVGRVDAGGGAAAAGGGVGRL